MKMHVAHSERLASCLLFLLDQDGPHLEYSKDLLLMQQDSTASESGSSISSSGSAAQSCAPYHPTLPLPNSSPSLPSSPPDPQIATDDAQYSGLQSAQTTRPPPP